MLTSKNVFNFDLKAVRIGLAQFISQGRLLQRNGLEWANV